MTNSIKNENNTKEHLGRSYIWDLYRLLPSFGYFFIEIKDEENVETLDFSKNTDDESGKQQLFDLLGRFPDFYHKVEAEFDFGFGFDLKVRVTV